MPRQLCSKIRAFLRQKRRLVGGREENGDRFRGGRAGKLGRSGGLYVGRSDGRSVNCYSDGRSMSRAVGECAGGREVGRPSRCQTAGRSTGPSVTSSADGSVGRSVAGTVDRTDNRTHDRSVGRTGNRTDSGSLGRSVRLYVGLLFENSATRNVSRSVRRFVRRTVGRQYEGGWSVD